MSFRVPAKAPVVFLDCLDGATPVVVDISGASNTCEVLKESVESVRFCGVFAFEGLCKGHPCRICPAGAWVLGGFEHLCEELGEESVGQISYVEKAEGAF